MYSIDDIVYYACWAVLVIHCLNGLYMIAFGRCSVYAATFLIGCAIWLDLVVLNLWFFLPATIQAASEIEFNLTGKLADDIPSVAIAILFSNALSYLATMAVGWLVGAMCLSNSLTLWQREGCDAGVPHSHSGLAGWMVRLAYQVEGYVGIPSLGYLPQTEQDEPMTDSRKSFLFAIPRSLHGYYLLLLAPPIELVSGSDRVKECWAELKHETAERETSQKLTAA